MSADADQYTLITKTVDEECCNPLKVWHDLGEPQYLDEAQTALLRSSANPLIKSEIVDGKDGKISASFDVNKNGVVYFELKNRTFTPDRGYDYDRVLNFH